MKLTFPFFVALLALSLTARAEPVGNAFTWQGRLDHNGAPASGSFDLKFELFNVAVGGNPVGAVERLAQNISRGLFSTDLDFGGPIVFDGTAYWLAVSAKIAGASNYVAVPGRTVIRPTPYALDALRAGAVKDGAVTSNSLANGAVTSAKLSAGAVGLAQLNAPAAPSPGQLLAFDGSNLSWVNPAGGGGSGPWLLTGATAYYNAGNVGIGTTTPAHRLSIGTGPPWTSHGWVGAVALPHAAAISWPANSAGQRFGMGHTDTGFYLFRTASNPGTITSAPTYDFVVDDSGNVGIGTTTVTVGVRLEVNGPAKVTAGGSGGFVQLGTPNGESGMSINGVNRAHIRFDDSTLKLLAGPGTGAPSSANGIAITTAGNVGIGKTNPGSKLDVLSDTSTAIAGKSTGGGGVGVYGESAEFNGVRGVANNVNHGAVVGVHNSAGVGVLGQSTGTGVFGNSLGLSGAAGLYGRSVSGPAVYAEGNAVQSRDKGGFAKAMAYIDPFLPAAQYVVRSFNSQSTTITVSRLTPGSYVINFGFKVDDRFISLTAQASVTPSGAYGVMVGTITAVSGNNVYVEYYRNQAGNLYLEDTRFHIIVF